MVIARRSFGAHLRLVPPGPQASPRLSGERTDPYGNRRIGATAGTKIHRSDFGLSWNAVLETGGVLMGDEISSARSLTGRSTKCTSTPRRCPLRPLRRRAWLECLASRWCRARGNLGSLP